MTLVNFKSIIAPNGLATMSDETSWSSVTVKMSFQRGVFAASRKIWLTSSTVVGRPARKVMFAAEPVITGVRKAMPSNLPFNFGIILVMAMAAPVVEGA